MSVIRDAFAALLEGRSLSEAETSAAFAEIFDGEAPEALVAGLLVAMRIKGESAPEMAGAARAMLARCRSAELDGTALLDCVGTGGDGAGTINVSTGAALVAASAGLKVAKHGNRAISGQLGAADVLEAFGVQVELEPRGLRRCLDRAGICFIFAPAYHPLMARFAGLRRALGIRTLFNLLGPLINPAQPRRALIGVADPRLVRVIAEAAAALGAEHALVVHGDDGIDEISTAAPTRLFEVRKGAALSEYKIEPQRFGVARSRPVRVASAAEGKQALQAALAGDPGPAQDLLALNSGAAIYVGGAARSLEEGVERGREILAAGRALETLERLRCASQERGA